MHVYFTTRGSRRETRRFIEEVEDIYLNLKNKKTGEKYGAVQVIPREVRLWECVFPETDKKRIKDLILEKVKGKWIDVKFRLFKKDKFKNGIEQL